jgi:hypothetical protein
MLKPLKDQGLPNHEIARLLGTSDRAVEMATKRLGLQRWKQHHLTPQESAEARRRYLAGESATRIANDFGCSRQTIVRRLVSDGVEVTRSSRHAKYATPSTRTPHGTPCVRWRRKQDYVMVRLADDHPFINYTNAGWIEEHRLRMMVKLDRPLVEGENVHHKNGVRDDNRLRNLELWSTSQPPGSSVKHKIRWAINFLTQYGYTITKEA